MLYTTKEIGEALGVSKSTARRYLQKIGAKPVHDPDQNDPRVFRYNDSVLKDIRQMIGPSDTPHGASFEALMKQLEEKDRQIAALQKALDQEQQLHAMAENKILQLESHPEEVPRERKSFWQRFRDAVRG